MNDDTQCQQRCQLVSSNLLQYLLFLLDFWPDQHMRFDDSTNLN